MKRVAIVVIVLVVGLSVALFVRLRQLNAYRDAPAGGTGTIEGTEVKITARIPARIVDVHVREGNAVKEGQLLVELDCAEPEAALAQAEAQLAAAESKVAAARAQEKAAAGNTAVAARMVKAATAEKRAAEASQDHVEKDEARLRALYESGAVAGADYDRVKAARDSTSEKIEAIRANRAAAAAKVGVAHETREAAAAQVEAAVKMADAAQAAVDRAAAAVRECRLSAPRAALVQTRSYEPGEVVLPGANLITLVYLDEVRATFYLPNAELAKAAPGREVTVVADAYPAETFAGTIRHVSAEAEFTPKNVQTREDRDRLVYGVEVVIPNPDHKLRPGMPAEVTIDGTGR